MLLCLLAIVDMDRGTRYRTPIVFVMLDGPRLKALLEVSGERDPLHCMWMLLESLWPPTLLAYISAGSKLRDLNAEESWALLEDLSLHDNKSWNKPRDFAKPVKAIALPQDVLSTSDRRLIEL
ncbi:hypothetical protein Tco_0564042 [Tanacetum coccineum]